MDYNAIKEMAAERGVRINELLALAPKNDPFYTGTPAERTRAMWFAAVYQAAGFNNGRAPHLRRVHYWTVSQKKPVPMPDDKGNVLGGKPYENTQRCWEFLIEAAKAARYLHLVPMDGIVDNKNPNPHLNAYYWHQDPGFEIEVPDLEAPEIRINGIENGDAQPYHLEVWCEKSTMNDVLLPVCQNFNANLVTFEGEVSITSVCVNLMRRIKDSGDKPTRIFYISDFDPAGNSMPVAMSRKLEFSISESDYDYDVRVRPIALTSELVQRYNLPRIPIKETERRAAKFENAFGTGAVELDALEAIYPGTLANLLETELRHYYSAEAYWRTHDSAQDLQNVVNERIAEITERYQEHIDALKAMQEELREVSVDASEYAVERFEPETDEEDEDWLFDSQRSYLEQINYYKAHKGLEGVEE